MKRIPILRSSAVLRQEYFGGFVFNHFLPPQLRMDQIRFEIACMCDGRHSLQEIHNQVQERLDHSQEYVKLVIQKTLNELEDRFLLYWRDEKIDLNNDFSTIEKKGDSSLRYLSAPLGLIWELTHACNLKCKHCFSQSGRPEKNELTTQEIKNAIDSFSESKVFFINFTGGEPMMRGDLFDILQHATTKKISIDLSTNGLLIGQNTIDQLKETNVFQVQVSIDGLEETHDNLRGPGAFQHALRSIELLRNNDLQVVVSATINKTNIKQASDIIDFTANVGASIFKITLFAPIGRGGHNKDELSLSQEDVRYLATIMATKQDEYGDRLTLHNDNCFPWLLQNSPLYDSNELQTKNVCCAAGTSSLFITASGDFVPCPFLRDFVIGNLRDCKFQGIWESDLLNIFRNLTPNDYKGKCNKCVYLGYKCFGGCRAAAFMKSGDLYGEDPYCYKSE